MNTNKLTELIIMFFLLFQKHWTSQILIEKVNLFVSYTTFTKKIYILLNLKWFLKCKMFNS